MKRSVWLICNRRNVLVDVQRQINSNEGLKAYCFFSMEALSDGAQRIEEDVRYESPSLILVDYETDVETNFSCVHFLHKNKVLAGVPIFFMTKEKTEEKEDVCYELGATVVLPYPFSARSLLRIEKAAQQYEMTRSYEQLLVQQSAVLKAAREIQQLNEKLEVRNAFLYSIFGKYFSEEVVEAILEKPEGGKLGGEKHLVTVMMADLRGFTSLADRLSADTMVDMLDYFLGVMTKIITEYKGTVIEFVGDAILAVFGAPLELECSEANAIAAALEMQNSMELVNEFNREKGFPLIQMGIGLHKGEVFIGNIGSEYLMRYNVIGQAVNLCARIENYSLGGQILVSKQTLTNIAKQVHSEGTFYVSVKGIRVQIPICSVMGIEGDYNITLQRNEPSILKVPEKYTEVALYIMREKCTVEFAAFAEILVYNDAMIRAGILGKLSRELFDYADMEIVIGGVNAYGKLVKWEDNEVLIHFTFISEHFMEKIEAERR